MTELEEAQQAAVDLAARERLAGWVRAVAVLSSIVFALVTWPGGVSYGELTATVVELMVALSISLCSDWVARGVRSWR